MESSKWSVILILPDNAVFLLCFCLQINIKNSLNIFNIRAIFNIFFCKISKIKFLIFKCDEYIFSLKGNQGNLSDDVTLYFEKNVSLTESFFVDYNKEHGRIETRKCWVVDDVKWLTKMHTHWSTIKSIVRIESTREIKGAVTIEDRYYVSSLQATAEKMLTSIRGHWAIENSLHWVLDMSFFDDQSRIRKGNAPHVMSILRHVAFNLLQLVKTKRQSIKGLRKMCGWDEKLLESVITKKSS